MKNLDLSVIALLAIVAIIGFLFIGGGEKDDGQVPLPAIVMDVTPSAVHPPEQVAISVERGNWPDGSQFEIFADDVSLGFLSPGFSLTTVIRDWPTDLKAVATNPQGKQRTEPIALTLRNEPPRFLNLHSVGYPSGQEDFKFSLLYRSHGCDSGGEPTNISGIKDPDYANLEPWQLDWTDRWLYRAAIEIIGSDGRPTGVFEPVFICQDGVVRAIGADEWVDDPYFIWRPFNASTEPIASCLQFMKIDPSSKWWEDGGTGPLATMSVADRVNDPIEVPDEGLFYAAKLTLEGIDAQVTPKCGTTAPPASAEEQTGKTNRLLHVWVLEFDTVYHAGYMLFASNSTCGDGD